MAESRAGGFENNLYVMAAVMALHGFFLLLFEKFYRQPVNIFDDESRTARLHN